MDLVKQIETPFNNATSVFNEMNRLLRENNIKDSTGTEIAQMDANPSNPAWLFALACGSLHTSWQEQLAKAYAALDPQSCEDDQVLVLASLAGISRGNGKPSHVTVLLTNTTNSQMTIPAGMEFKENVAGQTWALDKDVTLAASGSEGHSLEAALYSSVDGVFSIPAETTFTVQTDLDPNPYNGVTCISLAASYEGETIESLSSLRNRISQGVEQSDFITQAKNAIESLPGIESCSIWFNPQISGPILIGQISIPARTCYIAIKGVDITQKLAETYFANMDIPAVVGSLESTCHLGMQDMAVKYDAAVKVTVNVYVSIRKSDAASGADGAYREAVLAKSGSLAAGENLTAQMVSEWVMNIGYATVIGCNVGTSTGLVTDIEPNQYVVFTPESIQVNKIEE